MDFRNVVIVVLAIGCAVLGYLLWDSQRNGFVIKAPGVDIRAK